MSFEDWKASWKNRSVTWVEILVEQFPFLDEEEAGDLLSQKRIHPLPKHQPRLSESTVLQEGQILLVTHAEIEAIPGFFSLIYAENPGAAWGILGEAPLFVRKVMLQFVSLAAMILIFFVVWRVPEDHLLSVLALSGIMGGALGNFVDRFGRHFVVDFLDMYIGDAHWPTYNVADIGITVGVGLLAIQILRKKSPV